MQFLTSSCIGLVFSPLQERRTFANVLKTQVFLWLDWQSYTESEGVSNGPHKGTRRSCCLKCVLCQLLIYIIDTVLSDHRRQIKFHEQHFDPQGSKTPINLMNIFSWLCTGKKDHFSDSLYGEEGMNSSMQSDYCLGPYYLSFSLPQCRPKGSRIIWTFHISHWYTC